MSNIRAGRGATRHMTVVENVVRLALEALLVASLQCSEASR